MDIKAATTKWDKIIFGIAGTALAAMGLFFLVLGIGSLLASAGTFFVGFTRNPAARLRDNVL